MHDLKSIKTRALNVGMPFRVWAKLASEPGSIVHQPQISNWFDGIAPSADKQKRLLAALEAVEELCAADELKLDLSDADNVRAAIARLAEKRAESNAANILAEDSKPRWARAVAVPADSDLLSRQDAVVRNE